MRKVQITFALKVYDGHRAVNRQVIRYAFSQLRDHARYHGLALSKGVHCRVKSNVKWFEDVAIVTFDARPA